MTKGFAIELYFDETTEKNIRSFRDSLYQTGIQPFLGIENDRPHVSLAVFGMEDADRLIKIAEQFAQQTSAFAVELTASGVFSTTDNVVFLLPLPSQKLLETHQAFHRILKDERILSSHYYLPDHWLPHCTIEYGQPDDQFELMTLRCKKNFSPIRGTFSSLGVVAYRPIEYIAEFVLKTKDES